MKALISREQKNILELNRSKLGVLVGFLTRQCHLEGHVTKAGLKHNRDCRYFLAKDENREHPIAAIIDNGEISPLKPTQLLQFVNALRLDGVL